MSLLDVLTVNNGIALAMMAGSRHVTSRSISHSNCESNSDSSRVGDTGLGVLWGSDNGLLSFYSRGLLAVDAFGQQESSKLLMIGKKTAAAGKKGTKYGHRLV